MIEDTSLFEIISGGKKFAIHHSCIVAMVKLDSKDTTKPELASEILAPKATKSYFVKNYSTTSRARVERDSYALWLRCANRELLILLDSVPRKLDSSLLGKMEYIQIDADFIQEHGSLAPSDDNEPTQKVGLEDGYSTEVSAELSRSLVLVEVEGQSLAFDATAVLGLLPLEDLHPLVLVHSRALGCVEYQGQYLPVLANVNQGKYEQGNRILLMNAAGTRIGVSISKVVDVVSDLFLDEKNSETALEIATQQFFARLQELPLEEMYLGYQKVFSNAKHAEKSLEHEASGLQVYLKISVGDTMCVPLELIEKIELKGEGEGEAGLHLSADGEHLNLFRAKSYYFPEREQKPSKTARVLILKNDAMKVAVEVEGVLGFVYVSRASQLLYGQWLFGNLNPRFQGDVLGFVHAKSYFGSPIHSFACINFDSMFLANRNSLLREA